MAEIVDMIVEEEISSGTGNDLLGLYFQNEKRSPVELVDQLNWRLIKDREVIKKICMETIELYPKVSRKYARNGHRKYRSVLILNVLTVLGNRVNVNYIWDIYDELLRKDKN